MLKKLVTIIALCACASTVYASKQTSYPALNNPTAYMSAQNQLGGQLITKCSKQPFFQIVVKFNKHHGLLWLGSQAMKIAKYWSDSEKRLVHEIYYTRIQLTQAKGGNVRKLTKRLKKLSGQLQHAKRQQQYNRNVARQAWNVRDSLIGAFVKKCGSFRL